MFRLFRNSTPVNNSEIGIIHEAKQTSERVKLSDIERIIRKLENKYLISLCRETPLMEAVKSFVNDLENEDDTLSANDCIKLANILYLHNLSEKDELGNDLENLFGADRFSILTSLRLINRELFNEENLAKIYQLGRHVENVRHAVDIIFISADDSLKLTQATFNDLCDAASDSEVDFYTELSTLRDDDNLDKVHFDALIEAPKLEREKKRRDERRIAFFRLINVDGSMVQRKFGQENSKPVHPLGDIYPLKLIGKFI